jgi:acyl carrier protein
LELEERLTGIFGSVLGLDASTLADDDGPTTISEWDSVTHLNLILAIEAEFGIQFETHEIPELLSVGKIRARLRSV